MLQHKRAPATVIQRVIPLPVNTSYPWYLPSFSLKATETTNAASTSILLTLTNVPTGMRKRKKCTSTNAHKCHLFTSFMHKKQFSDWWRFFFFLKELNISKCGERVLNDTHKLKVLDYKTATRQHPHHHLMIRHWSVTLVITHWTIERASIYLHMPRGQTADHHPTKVKGSPFS